LEAISPELALIDPELARADLARLAACSVPEVTIDLETIRAAADRAPPEPEPKPEAGAGPQRPQSRALRALVGLSLAANGVLVAIVVAGGRAEPAFTPPVAFATVTAQPTASVASAAAARVNTITPGRPSGQATAAVEQEILALVVQSPSGKLPRTLVDPKTGLAKNNLQAACHGAASNAFLCVVRPLRHKPGEGLYVRYRPSRDGRGSFTWYPYRSG
jgi:hypothetical protein